MRERTRRINKSTIVRIFDCEIYTHNFYNMIIEIINRHARDIIIITQMMTHEEYFDKHL